MRSSRKNKKTNKFIYLSFYILVFIASFLMLYSLSLLNGIENKVRILLSIDLIVILIFLFFLSRKFIYHSHKKHFGFLLFCFLYTFILSISSYYIYKTYHVIDKMTSTSTTYYSSLITLKENKANSISDITTGTIGYLSDTSSVDGNQMPKEIISREKIKNKVVEYDSYISLIDALLDKKVDYIFVPGNYILMFSSLDGVDFESLEENTKVLYTKEKDISNDTTNKSNSLTEPFTVLIMGVDSEVENIKGSTFNGDALMLITFNPTTLNTTILSIPRDSYVPIACFTNQRKNKITHAAWYGENCMMDTIENFLDVEIDYYVKINFKGVVKLIDTLGGVDVDVPYSFCEQDSNRRFGSNTIYVKEGAQHLNGEQALALARNRKSNSNKCNSEWTGGVRNDFVRGQNQQLVLRALLNQLKKINNLDTIYSLMNTISNNMETNMSTNEILSLYNIGKDIIVKAGNEKMEDLVGFQRLYLNGEDARIYDSKTGLNLYNYVLYTNSVKAVSNAMKINLGITKPTMIKNFSFDINNEYEEEIIGKKETGLTNVVKLPSFIGMSEAKAKQKASSIGINATIKYVQTGSGTNLTVIKQSVSSGTDVSYVNSLILTVLKKETTSVDTNTKKPSNTNLNGPDETNKIDKTDVENEN